MDYLQEGSNSDIKRSTRLIVLIRRDLRDINYLEATNMSEMPKVIGIVIDKGFYRRSCDG